MDRNELRNRFLLEAKFLEDEGRIQTIFIDERERETEIRIVPVNTGSASLSLIIGRFDSDFEVVVGDIITFDRFRIAEETCDFIGKLCQAVFEGKVSGVATFVGERPVRCEVEIDLGDEKLFYNRRNLFARGESRRVEFSPY